MPFIQLASVLVRISKEFNAYRRTEEKRRIKNGRQSKTEYLNRVTLPQNEKQRRRRLRVNNWNKRRKRASDPDPNPEFPKSHMMFIYQKRHSYIKWWKRIFTPGKAPQYAYQLHLKLKRPKSLQLKIRRRLKRILKAKCGIESCQLIGCSASFLKVHLASLFKRGMSWSNHGWGPGKWHIDHIIPLSKFDLSRQDQLLQCCHFTNLQPLWHTENLNKAAKIVAPVQPSLPIQFV